MKKHKSYRILISSTDKHSSFKEIKLSGLRLKLLLSAAGMILVLFTAGLVDYLRAFSLGLGYQHHQEENTRLKLQLKEMKQNMTSLYARLNQIEDFSNKIKTSFGLTSENTLAIGPLVSDRGGTFTPSHGAFHGPPAHISSELVSPAPPSMVSPPQNPSGDGEEDILLVYMDQMDAKSQKLKADMTFLLEKLYERQDIISSTPTIMPIKTGWVSSHFGYRTYPFTGEVSLHEGIDIAAHPGTPVHAPANGVVVFAGYKAGYGKVIVIDHGYQLSTLYGHLSDIMVSPWQKVNREDVIGAVGNTGKSSGPHLHYEVRIADVPVDPKSYILSSDI